MGCRIRFVPQPSAVGLIESVRTEITRSGDVSVFRGRSFFPRPSFCRCPLEHNHMSPRARETSCIMFELNEKITRPFLSNKREERKENLS